MPAEFAQQRILERFLQHRYTRVPRGSVAAPTTYDDQNNPQPLESPVVGAPAPIADLPCLYLARSAYAFLPSGLVQTDTPTLIVAWDDPLQVGDQVRDVADSTSGFVYQAYATVESQSSASNAGAPIYQMFSLLEAEVD